MIIYFRVWEKRVSQNPNIKVKDIKINTKKELGNCWMDWIYFRYWCGCSRKRDKKQKDFLFTNGTHIAPELIDLKLCNH